MIKMYVLSVSYKGYDQDRDIKIIRKVGSRKWTGSGYDLVSRQRDLSFEFRFIKAARAAKRALRNFAGLKFEIIS